MANNNNGEPSSAPQAEKWYELKLGSSFKGNSSSKFSTLRYEFKPASIDKTQPGSLHKNKENRVTVDFNNNQPGKPKVSFEGSSEDYKENDVHAVLFFDGESFRLERLSRAVKRLRHVRLPGESASAANMSSAANLESKSPQIGKFSRTPPLSKQIAPSVPVEVERIDIGEPERNDMIESERIDIGEPEQIDIDGTESPGQKSTYAQIPNLNHDEGEENIEIDIDIDDEEEAGTNMGGNRQGSAPYTGVNMNIPSQNESDDEFANMGVNDDSAGREGPNAAAEALNEDSSSSSDSSGSGSSGSGSASRSGSSSDSSDDDSASSAGELDI